MPNQSVNKAVLVVGDLILDIYHFGQMLAASAEGLAAIREQKTTAFFGGAGSVVRNILELDGKVIFATRLGDDNFGEFAASYSGPNLKKIFLTEKERTTIVKERFVIGNKKVLKWNHLEDQALGSSAERTILREIKRRLPQIDKIITADYRHGLISKNFARALIALGKRAGKPVYVDSQVSQQKSNHHWYQGADLMCLNLGEAKRIDPKFDTKQLSQSLQRISRHLKIPNTVVKLGPKGSAALLGDKFVRTPGMKVRAVDPTGAGDAFFAALALAPFPPSPKALQFANRWAAKSTTKIGSGIFL